MNPAGQWSIERALEPAGDRDQPGDIDPGRDAHGVEHRQRIFAADVAGGPWRERTAPDAADRTLEQVDAGL